MTKGFLLIGLILASACIGVSQSGGSFAITQSVIANGGDTSSNGSFSVTGTIGQSVAGTNSGGAPFVVFGGFWQGALGPTAATVSVSGRVLDAAGTPLRNVLIMMADSTGTVYTARSNALGYFAFDDVRSGDTYVVNITARTHQFVPQVLSIKDALSGLEFRALP